MPGANCTVECVIGIFYLPFISSAARLWNLRRRKTAAGSLHCTIKELNNCICEACQQSGKLRPFSNQFVGPGKSGSSHLHDLGKPGDCSQFGTRSKQELNRFGGPSKQNTMEFLVKNRCLCRARLNQDQTSRSYQGQVPLLPDVIHFSLNPILQTDKSFCFFSLSGPRTGLPTH